MFTAALHQCGVGNNQISSEECKVTTNKQKPYILIWIHIKNITWNLVSKSRAACRELINTKEAVVAIGANFVYRAVISSAIESSVAVCIHYIFHVTYMYIKCHVSSYTWQWSNIVSVQQTGILIFQHCNSFILIQNSYMQ